MGLYRLADRTALVTGGARRLGRAIAEALARSGADVVVHYRSSAAEAEEAIRGLRGLGVRAWSVQADLAEQAGVEALWHRAREMASAGRIDILVNSASIFPEDTLLDFTPEDLEANIRVNTLAPVRLCRLLAAGGGEGAVVNLLDSRMSGHMRAHVSYQMSKRLLADFTRLLARELAPRVRVNAVAPGMVLPPPGMKPEAQRKLAGTNLLGRWGDPEDVARAVLFLIENDFVTGQILFVDGGGSVKECLYG